MNPILAKKLAKLAAGFVFSAVIGYTVKFGKRVDAMIDEHYAAPEDQQVF